MDLKQAWVHGYDADNDTALIRLELTDGDEAYVEVSIDAETFEIKDMRELHFSVDDEDAGFGKWGPASFQTTKLVISVSKGLAIIFKHLNDSIMRYSITPDNGEAILIDEGKDES